MKRLFSILLLMLALVMVLAACNGNDEVTISVDSDGYVIVNGVKTEHKVHTADEVTVNGDGYVVVNGVVTDIVADKDDVITVDKDGYVIVNGVKTEYEVKNKNHSFGAWKLYNEDETNCEKKLYYRVCGDCASIEWKEGTYQDHVWTTVTTDPTCQAGGFDTKTCNTCGKVEICNETPIGDHTYLPNHSYDNGYHWLACQNCTNIKDKAEHTMDAEGVCTVCSQLVGDTEGVIYDISSDGTYAMVIDYTGTATRVKMAAEYQGLPVTQIYENAFYGKNITMVIIPDSVTSIGSYAFSSCNSLTSVTIPDSVTSIGGSAFYGCSLTSVTIPDSVTTIGDKAFSGCGSLTSVTIGNSVTTIGDEAFFYCDSLTSVTIGNGVTTIGDSAFSYCSRLTSVTIPDSVTTIGNYAFSGCGRLTSVTIGNGVTSISNSAFNNCNALQYAEYGNCKYLGSADNPYFALITVVNNNYSTYTIHEDSKIIADHAFINCGYMTAITIPDSVTTIGDSAFRYCYSLTSVTIPNSVTSIGDYAFYGCAELTSVTIPDSVTTIGEEAFRGCRSLTEIHFAGTKEQWQAISKGSGWNDNTGNYTVHCTNGDLNKSGYEIN